MELILRRRTKFGRVVRLEVDGDDERRGAASSSAASSSSATPTSTSSTAPSASAGLWGLYGLDRPELKDEPWTPQTQPVLAPRRRAARPVPRPPAGRRARPPPVRLVRDVGRGVRRAGRRATRSVLAIKQTLYRTAGPDSRRSCGRSSTPPSRASRSSRSSSSRRASTSRPTSSGPELLEEAGVHVVYGAGRPQDARQDPPRRAPGARRHPPLLPRRHRQLQPEDGHDSTRTSAC